jgi:hypothetical protein
LHALAFAQTNGTRHILPPDIALEQILPSSEDQNLFAKNAAIHVSHILAEEVDIFHAHLNIFGEFFDPHAIVTKKSEEYFLPAYDQEQSSTRGNMHVLDHYYKDVLKIPNEVFEERERATTDGSGSCFERSKAA